MLSNPEVNPSFETLIRDAYGSIRRLAYHLCRHRDDAEDLTQEACLRAYRRFSLYDQRCPFDRWARAITYNLFLDRTRADKRKIRALSIDLVPEPQMDEAKPLASHMHHFPTEGINDPKLASALENLPALHRELLWLVCAEGYSPEQAAEAMQLEVRDVKALLRTAKAAVRRSSQTMLCEEVPA